MLSKAFVVTAHAGKSAAAAAAQPCTPGLMENCGGCCLDQDTPEIPQVVHGLENVL